MPNATTAQSMVTSRDVGLISLRLRLNILRTCGGHQNRIASAANPRFALGQRRDRPQERGRTLAVNPLSGAILSSVRLCDSARAPLDRTKGHTYPKSPAGVVVSRASVLATCGRRRQDRKSTRLNSSHANISYA